MPRKEPKAKQEKNILELVGPSKYYTITSA